MPPTWISRVIPNVQYPLGHRLICTSPARVDCQVPIPRVVKVIFVLDSFPDMLIPTDLQPFRPLTMISLQGLGRLGVPLYPGPCLDSIQSAMISSNVLVRIRVDRPPRERLIAAANEDAYENCLDATGVFKKKKEEKEAGAGPSLSRVERLSPDAEPLFAVLAVPFRCTVGLAARSNHLLGRAGNKGVDLPLPLGATFKPTHSRWNHSRLHPSASQATISP